MIEVENEHVQTGLALLTEQFKGQPNIAAILTAILNRVQEVEDELWVDLWGWVLEFVDPDDPTNVFNASGNQLDDLGAIVGEARNGRIDSDYIPAIKLRIRINRSKGRAEDMVQVANLISNLATYVEYFPLAWEISLYDVGNAGELIRLFAQAKAASSYGVLLASTWAEANVFKFDHAGNNTNVFDSVTGTPPDKRFPMALPTNPLFLRFT